MPIIAARVTVTASPTLVLDPQNGSVSGPITALVKNPGPASVYLGGATVSSGTGFELATGGSVDVELVAGDLLFAVTASGSQELQTIRLMG